ncbi:MAG: hypothetical protein L6Q99_09780 [Planctomycetes bacterium]|nr:hypothetical protein [Planctomycetota bacterium]
MTPSLHRTRFAALFALCVYVVASIALFRHESEFVHAVCEHGERVHVELAAGTHAAADCAAHEERRGPLVEAERSHHDEHAHTHCSLAPSNAPTRAPETPNATFVVPSRVTGVSPLRAVARAESTPRYLLAPHHSPPRG